MAATLCTCAIFSKIFVSRPMITSISETKFEVYIFFRLGAKLFTDIHTIFQKPLFRTQGPLKRVENTKYRYWIFDPISILLIPYMLYQVIESKNAQRWYS